METAAIAKALANTLVHSELAAAGPELGIVSIKQNINTTGLTSQSSITIQWRNRMVEHLEDEINI